MKKKIRRKRRILCEECNTGMTSYMLDPTSPTCPYISCYDGFSCVYYVPFNNENKKREYSDFAQRIKRILKIS